VYYTVRTDRSVEISGARLAAMLSGRVARVAAGVIVALILAGSSLPLSAVDPPAEETSEVVAIRGRVVCVDSVPTATVSPESDPCNQPGAVKDGALHHLHYRCDVCNITTYAPGPCWCCGAPFELREGPAGGEQPDPGQ